MGRRVGGLVSVLLANRNPNGPEFRRPQATRLAKRAGVARRATPAFLVLHLQTAFPFLLSPTYKVNQHGVQNRQ